MTNGLPRVAAAPDAVCPANTPSANAFHTARGADALPGWTYQPG